jgi:hypothetical protein
MTVAEKLTRAKADYDEVYEAGKKAEYDAFWDSFQQNGERTMYTAAGVFSGYAFDFGNFYPKYDICPIGNASQLFYSWGSSGSLKKRLEECGVVLDTSQATNLTNAFAYTHITEIPTIDCRQLGGSSTGVFLNAWGRLKTIEKLIVNENVTFTNWFNNSLLESIRFEGVIGQDLSLGDSKALSKASIESIIGCLSDTATGKTLTLSKTAVENTFTDTEWGSLVATKPNWTITLV